MPKEQDHLRLRRGSVGELQECPTLDARLESWADSREVGWTLEELAYYLGHITRKGIPAIQTTIRYTQVSRTKVRDKLSLLKQ